MDIPNAISSLQQEFQSTYELSFNIDDINCEIYITTSEDEKIQFVIQVNNYSCKIKPTKVMIYRNFDTIESSLTYLNNIFREDGSIKYSKVVDEIFESDEKLKYEEQVNVAKRTIINNVSECCVCGDINDVLTKCNHNLCRYCFSKMYRLERCCSEHSDYVKRILCPICKREIY